MDKRGCIFSILITLSLLLPVVAQSVARFYAPVLPMVLARNLNDWHGRDINPMLGNQDVYRTVEGVLWRRYTHADQPPVDCLMQRAVNLQHVHDLLQCLELAGTSPVCVGDLDLQHDRKASLYEYQWHHTRYYCAFLLQSNDACASFPPRTLSARLSTGLMSPCRLVQLATPVRGDTSSALRRLTQFANTISDLPI